MIKKISFGILSLSIFIASLGLLARGTVYACGKCRNVTAGEPLEVIGIDLTGIMRDMQLKWLAPLMKSQIRQVHPCT